MRADPIEECYSHYVSIHRLLMDNGEISDAIDVEGQYARVLLVSSASRFENIICEAIVGFAAAASASNPALVSFVRNKGVSRQYHTLFDWDRSNCNKFWSLFGADAKVQAENEVKASEGLTTSMQQFMSIGRGRNSLVHQGFVDYQIGFTADELIAQYRKAQVFVDYLCKKLSEWAELAPFQADIKEQEIRK